MTIPEEIKNKAIADEIDLQILAKEIMEREREKEHIHYFAPLRPESFNKNSNYDTNDIRDNLTDSNNIDKNIRDKNNNKIVINLDDKKDSNLKYINNKLPKFNKTYSMRLYYSIRIYYLILFLNIFFPGIGTIIAAIGWGNTCKYKDRTKNLLLRGIIQILTIIFIFGWVLAIFDAINYFEYCLF